MNRANQHALFQATNQSLLNIRQQEINYYTNLNAAFGTQAALIGGFTYGIFTQNDYTSKAFAAHIIDLYWIFSAATIAAAIHVILTAMLLQVLGPGLALHGPVGSMVRACEGMREEQKSVVYGFAFMIITFSCSTLLLFWTVMSLASAIGSTVVWVIAVRFYYYYCERIYLRFYWKQEGDYLSRDSEVDPSDQYADHPHAVTNNANDNPMHSSPSTGSRKSVAMSPISRGNEEGVALADKSSSGRRGSNFFPAVRVPFSSSGKADASARSVSPASGSSNIEGTFIASKNLVMQGFLLMKHPPSRSNAKQKTTWKRYYFTLNGMGHFFYYRSRQDYRERPQEPKRKRPLVLSDFSVAIWNGDILADKGTKGSSSVLFQFLLSPKEGGEQSAQDIQEAMRAMLDSDSVSVALDDNDDDSDESAIGGSRRTSTNLSSSSSSSGSSSRKWAMRCDTEEELHMWLDAMRDISPSSFSD